MPPSDDNWPDIEKDRRGPFDFTCERDLVAFFDQQRTTSFYGNELQVRFEKKYFHWVTARALHALHTTASLASNDVSLPPGQTVRFYRHPSHRYWRREQRAKLAHLAKLSNPIFTRALGAQGEMLSRLLLAELGLKIVAKDTNEYKGHRWDLTENDLDFICEDRIHASLAFGVEVKNTLGYIPHDELKTKILMCRTLGLFPVFIMRWSPKSYIYEVNRADGFVLLFGHQHYPLGHEALLTQTLSIFKYPATSASRLPDLSYALLGAWLDKKRSTMPFGPVG